MAEREQMHLMLHLASARAKAGDRRSRDTPKLRQALFIARAPSDNDGDESSHHQELSVPTNGYKSHPNLLSAMTT